VPRDLQQRLQGFIDELKRRKVIRVALGYAAGAFVVAQAATTFFPALHLPEWTVTLVVAGCVIGFPVALILAWAFDVVRTSEAHEAGAHASKPRRYRWLMIPAAVLVVGAIVIGLVVRSPSAADDAKVDPDLIAVFPFSGSVDPSLDYLREGMVHLLAATMGSVGQTQVVHPRTAMDAWQRRFGEQYRNVPPDSARAIARALGAGRFLLGSIVGTPARLAVTTDIFGTGDGKARVHAQQAKPADSLQVLVDQLTAQLLSLDAGERRDRLANLTSTSLDALSAYLKGQEALRKGHLARAANHFDEALDIDSTFALAAYFGRVSARSNAISGRRQRLAWTYRERLPATDRDLIVVQLGENYPAERPPLQQTLQAWNTYLAKYPDRADAWVEYGEELIGRGAAGEIPDYIARAREAFNRALAIDSTYMPALSNLIELAEFDDPNRAEFERLFDLLQRRAPSSYMSPTMSWARAVLRGDSQLMATHWQAAMDNPSPALLAGWVQHGVGRFEDVEKAFATWEERRARAAGLNTTAYWFYLNAGRPTDAERYRKRLPYPQNLVQARIAPMYDALFYGGDTTAARLAADTVAAALARSRSPASERLFACALGQWRLRHGQTTGVDALIAALEAPDSVPDRVRGNALCAHLLRTLRAFVLDARDARAQLERLDSAALEFAMPSPPLTDANLAIAQLRERVGDPKGALRALRRFHFFRQQLPYLAPILRERGRLALATGDTASAIKDWTQYLKMREHAEPSMMPEVERIRQQLHTLRPEPRR
jgi:tetratricopeptide (TPR) repeat protein